MDKAFCGEGDWKAFEEWLRELRKKFSRRSRPRLLFRGQQNSEWPLTTTLERNGQVGMTFKAFYDLIIGRIGPAVETFTGVPVPAYDDGLSKAFAEDLELLTLRRRFPPVDLYSYMVYLRHHGFPSPLLDWSHSPYVAAFFAFRDECGGSAKRSIYAYCEMPEGFKGGGVGDLSVRQIGSYVRSHRRHFRQQSDYTICSSWDSNHGWRFASHQELFDHPRPKQDFLWRFDIPSSERDKVLQSLDDHNLNAFSLFDSEETLLETMWFREQVLRELTP
jgi:FRG domain